jgi:SWI/SNF-related matrix-associated actin-dependent regulator of chromatin subfamily A containing DEAD/H box 1
VDGVIENCEKVGKELNDILAVWASLAEPTADSSTLGEGAASGVTTPTDTSGMNIVAVDAEAIKAKAEATATTDPVKAQALEGYMSTQPATLAEGVVLKDYQLLGVNWLSLLHRRKLSCILADEMGAVASAFPRW